MATALAYAAPLAASLLDLKAIRSGIGFLGGDAGFGLDGRRSVVRVSFGMWDENGRFANDLQTVFLTMTITGGVCRRLEVRKLCGVQ